MCRGIPTVTTSVGSEGMEVTHMEHLAIVDDAMTMVDTIDTLLGNKSVWDTLEQNSRKLIKEKYTWKALFSSMHKNINKLLMATHQHDTKTKVNKSAENLKIIFSKTSLS